MIVDLFAGPGGWDEGLATLGVHDVVGIELDLAACQTAHAAGHGRVQADVALYPTSPFVGRTEGLIASPPCTDWSLAGTRSQFDGKSGHLVREVMRWASDLRPRWIACEQVPPALGVWERYVHELRDLGYSAWAGILNAADYGVPQTRRRAILLATLDDIVSPPSPTHSQTPGETLFGSLHPWASLGQSVGWVNGVIRTGNNTMKHSRQGSKAGDGGVVAYRRPVHEPAPTVDCKAVSAWVYESPDGSTAKLSVAEAGVIQSFRPDYPWHGTKAKQAEQVGNAIPPVLAAAVLRGLVDSDRREQAA